MKKKNFNPIIDKFQPLAFHQCVKIFQAHDDWIVQEAPATPWYWWVSAVAWIYGLTSVGYSTGDFLTYCTKDVGTLVIGRKTFMRQAEHLIRQELAGKSVINQWRRVWQGENKNYVTLVKCIQETDLALLDEKEFIQLFKSFCQAYYKVEYLPLSNEFFIPYTDQLLKELMFKYPKYSEAIAGLVMPKKKSFMQKEEQELLVLKKLPKSKQKQALKKHAEKWYFITSGYDGAHTPSISELKHKMAGLKLKKQNMVEKKLPASILDHKTKVILKLTKKIADWKDERKRNNLIGSFFLDKFAREFSRRYNLPWRLVRYAIPAEFMEIKQGGQKFKNMLTKRAATGVAWGMSGFKYSGIFMGRQYEEIKKSITGLKQNEEILTGIAACPGKAFGKVHIIHNPTKEKIKAGEILVTSMTRPEFVPLIKKARAVLCDEGGLLSHAAIISRELHIPCIVGMRHAMASLKDGDLVEVDANKGIVKKLK